MSADTSIREIPDGWQQLTLGDLVSISNKAGLPVENPILPFVGMEHIESETGKLLSYGDPADYRSSSYIVDSTQVLYGRLRPYLNKVFIPKEDSYASREFIPMNLNEDLNQQFLLYRLRSSEFVEFAISLNTGDRPRVKWPQMAEYPICLPPIAEQENIVEILEEQLSRLDAALASVSLVREKAARFRLSLLHAAFTGALTRSDSSNGALPDSWALIDLESLLSVSIGGIWGEESGLSEVDVDVVRVTELKAHGVIEPSTAAKRSVTRKQFESRALQIGDLLLEKSGGGPNTPVGRVGYVSSVDMPTVCSNFMQLMRPDIKKVSPVFLHLFLTFIHSNGETIPMQTSTTNIRNIKTSQYMALLVPLPQVDEQKTIIQILDEQLSRLDNSLAIAGFIEKKASAMRRSLLHSAFVGDLTREWREGTNV